MHVQQNIKKEGSVSDTEEGKTFLGAIRVIREKPRLASSHLPSRLSARTSASRPERISLRLDAGTFYDNLLRRTKFG